MRQAMRSRFSIGDWVVSRKTGFPGKGLIVGVLAAKPILYNKQHITGSGYEIWDKIYPGWEETFIYYVWYSKLRKPLTIEEYLEYKQENVTDYEIREQYKQIKQVQMISYPEDDLEFFDKELEEVDKVIKQVS